jgi:hypothetical protein
VNAAFMLLVRLLVRHERGIHVVTAKGGGRDFLPKCRAHERASGIVIGQRYLRAATGGAPRQVRRIGVAPKYREGPRPKA